MKNEYSYKQQKFGLPGIWIPSEVLLNPKISNTEKLLFGVIANLSKSETGCFATNEFLAKLVGVKKQSISNGISNLKENEYILVEFVTKKSGFDQRLIHINPLFPVIHQYVNEQHDPLLKRLYPPIKILIPPYKKDYSIKENIYKEKNIIESLPVGKAEADLKPQKELFPKEPLIQPNQFETFYKLYPRNAKKGLALIEWEKLCNQKNKQNIRPTWKQIRIAIRLQKKTKQWENPMYIPYPSNWLKELGWLNNVEEMNKVVISSTTKKSQFGYVGKSKIEHPAPIQM